MATTIIHNNTGGFFVVIESQMQRSFQTDQILTWITSATWFKNKYILYLFIYLLLLFIHFYLSMLDTCEGFDSGFKCAHMSFWIRRSSCSPDTYWLYIYCFSVLSLSLCLFYLCILLLYSPSSFTQSCSRCYPVALETFTFSLRNLFTLTSFQPKPSNLNLNFNLKGPLCVVQTC